MAAAGMLCARAPGRVGGTRGPGDRSRIRLRARARAVFVGAGRRDADTDLFGHVHGTRDPREHAGARGARNRRTPPFDEGRTRPLERRSSGAARLLAEWHVAGTDGSHGVIARKSEVAV